MEVSFNFDLVSSMFWAYFIGFSFALGVATAVIIAAYFAHKVGKQKEPKKNAS